GAGSGRSGGVVDGNDVVAVCRAMPEAGAGGRSGRGPTLVEAKTYRIAPHSSDDDDRSYRSRDEVEQWKKRDPIVRFRQYLEQAGLLDRARQDELEARARAEVDDAARFAAEVPYPDVATAATGVYAPAAPEA